MKQMMTALTLILAISGVTAAEDTGADKKKAEAVAAEIAAEWAKAPVKERTEVTAHSIMVAGKKLNYHATAGTLTIRDTDGKPTASVFYTHYTLDGVDSTKRPVMFSFNGGPGSASLWLHLGSYGPKRVVTDSPEFVPPAPFKFVDNEDTLLGTTDLVFIDAVGAGYSRPIGDAQGKDFWGVDQDVDAFARAIMRWVEKSGRWNSPKYVLGESYGTLRAGALAYQLEERGMALNGVMLLSSIMNYGVRQPGFDQLHLTYLPSYAATAWYHNKIPNKPASQTAFVEEARQYAYGPYAAALFKGDRISAEERDKVASELSRFTGLSPEFIKRANLRVELARFRKELLRDEHVTIGRFDSRYKGVDTDTAGERPETDPSSDAISGAYIGTLHDYLARTLNYRTEMPYRTSASEVKGFDWDWKHQPPVGGVQRLPATNIDLGAAMRINPHLRVLSLNGWYDMATPFFGTEYDLSHILLEPAQRANISFKYYDGGHMMYLNPKALTQLRMDLESFINNGKKGG